MSRMGIFARSIFRAGEDAHCTRDILDIYLPRILRTIDDALVCTASSSVSTRSTL